MHRSRREEFPDELSDEMLMIPRRLPKFEEKRQKEFRKMKNKNKDDENFKSEKIKMRSKSLGSMNTMRNPNYFKKAHKQKLPVFDEPMDEFFYSNMVLTKIFALGMAIKLKLFDIIKEKGNDDFIELKELQKILNLPVHIKQFMSLLNKLEFHGYLEKEGELLDSKFKNSEYSDKYFTSQSDTNYSYVYANVERYFKKFVKLEDNIKKGNLSSIIDDIYSDPEQTKDFVDFYSLVNQRNFENLIQNFNFEKYKSVIDLNGKNAELSIKIKKKFPEVRMISFDDKATEELAKENIKKVQMEDQIELIFGDIRKDNIPNCEVVIVPHIMQYFEEEMKKEILKKIYKSLENNGVLIIIENLIYKTEKDVEIPANKISFLLLLENYEGCHLTFQEYEEMLMEIGFKKIKKFHKDWISFVIVCVKIENENVNGKDDINDNSDEIKNVNEQLTQDEEKINN